MSLAALPEIFQAFKLDLMSCPCAYEAGTPSTLPSPHLVDTWAAAATQIHLLRLKTRPTRHAVYQTPSQPIPQTGTVLHASPALLGYPSLYFSSAACVFVTAVGVGPVLAYHTARMPLKLLLAVVPFPVPRS